MGGSKTYYNTAPAPVAAAPAPHLTPGNPRKNCADAVSRNSAPKRRTPKPWAVPCRARPLMWSVVQPSSFLARRNTP